METESSALSAPPKPKRFWRTLVFQYLLAVFFVGGLESLCLMDWRGLFWAVPLLAILRFHGAICRRLLPERLAIFGFLGLLFVWLPLHCAIWMFWLNPLQISEATTYITEPLVADGSRPYYYPALEQRVTPRNPPEENGFRLMAEKLGPQIIGYDPDSAHSDREKQRRMKKWETICSKLRIDQNTKAVLTFRPLRMYLEEYEKSVNPQPDREEQWDAYREWDKNLNEKVISLSPPKGKAWTAEEFPLAARWIDEQNAVFDLFSEAVQEPVFFRPFAWDGEGDSLFHNLDLRSLVVHVVVAMRNRILFRLGKNETEAAWQDVLALYRYAAHNRENAFMRFDLESGYMLAELAARDVLRYGNVSREQIVRFHADLQRFRVPLKQEIIDKVVFGERIYSLDEALTPIYITTSSETSNTVYLFRLLSWNHELIGLNKRYDAQIGRPLPVIYDKYTETPSRSVVDFSYYLLWKGIL